MSVIQLRSPSWRRLSPGAGAGSLIKAPGGTCSKGGGGECLLTPGVCPRAWHCGKLPALPSRECAVVPASGSSLPREQLGWRLRNSGLWLLLFLQFTPSGGSPDSMKYNPSPEMCLLLGTYHLRAAHCA